MSKVMTESEVEDDCLGMLRDLGYTIVYGPDISEGGLAIALSEMALGGRAEGELGLEVDLSEVGDDLKSYQKLFSETGGFVVEVAENLAGEFMEICETNGLHHVFAIGSVVEEPPIRINDMIELPLEKAKDAWYFGLREKM